MPVHQLTTILPATAPRWSPRPVRAPHHTISDVGLIGWGYVPLPGEVSLVHHGVRFREARPKRRRHVLEVWRQPLDRGAIVEG
jgi:magnesium chelatase family protein